MGRGLFSELRRQNKQLASVECGRSCFSHCRCPHVSFRLFFGSLAVSARVLCKEMSPNPKTHRHESSVCSMCPAPLDKKERGKERTEKALKLVVEKTYEPSQLGLRPAIEDVECPETEIELCRSRDQIGSLPIWPLPLTRCSTGSNVYSRETTADELRLASSGDRRWDREKPSRTDVYSSALGADGLTAELRRQEIQDLLDVCCGVSSPSLCLPDTSPFDAGANGADGSLRFVVPVQKKSCGPHYVRATRPETVTPFDVHWLGVECAKSHPIFSSGVTFSRQKFEDERGDQFGVCANESKGHTCVPPNPIEEASRFQLRGRDRTPVERHPPSCHPSSSSVSVAPISRRFSRDVSQSDANLDSHASGWSWSVHRSWENPGDFPGHKEESLHTKLTGHNSKNLCSSTCLGCTFSGLRRLETEIREVVSKGTPRATLHHLGPISPIISFESLWRKPASDGETSSSYDGDQSVNHPWQPPLSGGQVIPRQRSQSQGSRFRSCQGFGAPRNPQFLHTFSSKNRRGDGPTRRSEESWGNRKATGEETHLTPRGDMAEGVAPAVSQEQNYASEAAETQTHDSVQIVAKEQIVDYLMEHTHSARANPDNIEAYLARHPARPGALRPGAAVGLREATEAIHRILISGFLRTHGTRPAVTDMVETYLSTILAETQGLPRRPVGCRVYKGCAFYNRVHIGWNWG